MMKTTDFIGELYELGFGVSFELHDVHVVKRGILRKKVARISLRQAGDQEINDRRLRRMKPQVREELLDLILDYSNTPIEKRR